MRGITTTALNTANTGVATQIAGGNGYTLTAGTAGGAPIPMNVNNTSVGIGIACYATGTVSYTVYHTYDNIVENTSPIWFQHGTTGLVNATSTQESNFVIPIGAIQVILNSGTGSVITRIIQQGVI